MKAEATPRNATHKDMKRMAAIALIKKKHTYKVALRPTRNCHERQSLRRNMAILVYSGTNH